MVKPRSLNYASSGFPLLLFVIPQSRHDCPLDNLPRAFHKPFMPPAAAPRPPRFYEFAAGTFYRAAASGLLPATWFLGDRTRPVALTPRPTPLTVEIVSHCWNYSHLLAYQLSSLVHFPPTRLNVRMTVCWCTEDRGTAALLDFFAARTVPSVSWNWIPLPRGELLRRAIGRNRAALATPADWIWFTDCDLLFHAGCLDTLADRLATCAAPLVFPAEERTTALLRPDDAVLRAAAERPALVAIDAAQFRVARPRKATGPLQITHGDVARALGYCASLPLYQNPTDRWRKTYEDRAFRWLVGSQGVPLDIPSVYRIKHLEKGRYHGAGLLTSLRRRNRARKDARPPADTSPPASA